MVDLHRLGGTPLLLKHFLDMGLLDGSCLTVTGTTLAENLKNIPAVPTDQDLIAPADSPFKPYADMQICFGNLAPEGMVFKVSSMQSPTFTGTAMCFEDPRAITQAVKEKRLKPGTVVVLRHLGPVASGMPEVLVATSALSVPELDGKVALVSDTRVSGVSHGAIGVHCSPEAAIGGPIGLVEDGDGIRFDLLQGTIEWDVPETIINERREKHNLSQPTHQRGYLADFSATVSQAHEGCVSHWVLAKGGSQA
jgi:dihydroxy-acid dehydratase